MHEQVSAYKPFGLRTYVKPQRTGDIVLHWQKGEGPYRRKDITVGVEMIDKKKVEEFISFLPVLAAVL